MRVNPIGELFALPLQSAVRAQVLALQETISAIEALGVEDGRARIFRLRAERTVEERTIDPNTGAAKDEITVQPFEVNIPLLALLPVQTIQLQEMNVDFGVEIVEIESESIASSVLPPAAEGSSLAGSLALFSALGQSHPTTMKVHMKIAKEIPEGLARMGELLSDLLCGKPAKGPTIDQIRGMSPEIMGILRQKGIKTADDFLVSTETASGKGVIAKSLGVPADQIDTWRSEAARLARNTE